MEKKGSFSAPTSYLNGDAKMDRLFRIANKYAAIKADCTKLMPQWFNQCSILNFENGVLSIGVPNQSMMARVKLNSSLLMQGLAIRGWDVSKLRFKVVLDRIPNNERPPAREKHLSEKARASFEALYRNLDENGAQSTLKDAVKNLLKRR